MNTPIADFIRNYAARNPVRLHMPGHKGRELLGCEALDITEIPGADELYVADGIIGESERNAAGLFGTGATLYSTEGSSQCIRTMVYLAALNARDAHARNPYILATRNAHKTFLYALALTDLDVRWLVSAETDSLCACRITATDVAHALREAPEPPAISSPSARSPRSAMPQASPSLWTTPTAPTCDSSRRTGTPSRWGRICAVIPRIKRSLH